MSNCHGELCQGWISTKDSMPEKGKRVLFSDGYFVGEGFLNVSGKWKRYDGTFWEDISSEPVIEWMNLPIGSKI